MPELPEVETVKSGLQKLLPGKIIESVSFDWPKSFQGAQVDIDEFLIGSKIVSVKRRAKVLIVDLSVKYSLVIHLKMTGQLVFRGAQNFGAGHPSDSLVGKLPDKSTRVIFGLSDDSKLFFNDQRKFGWVRLLPTAEVKDISFFQKVGPEPLSDNFSAKDFRSRLHKRNKSMIKAVLLDQGIIAGVGNIYADESLWAARIHPETKVGDISVVKQNILYKKLREILQLSIDMGGSSARNYVDAEGRAGNYLDFAKVFNRTNQPCFRHPDTLIIKIRVAGRGTHLCPKCQKKVKGNLK